MRVASRKKPPVLQDLGGSLDGSVGQGIAAVWTVGLAGPICYAIAPVLNEPFDNTNRIFAADSTWNGGHSPIQFYSPSLLIAQDVVDDVHLHGEPSGFVHLGPSRTHITDSARLSTADRWSSIRRVRPEFPWIRRIPGRRACGACCLSNADPCRCCLRSPERSSSPLSERA